MSLSRYRFSKKLFERRYYGTSSVNYKIFNAVESDTLSHEVVLLGQAQRLDQLAGKIYGDSSLWWILSAASGIGWGLQVPPGTIIRIPTNINDVFSLL